MKHCFRRPALAFVALALVLCSATPSRGADRPDRELDRLATWLTGSFSSAAQAKRDTSFFDIRLHIVPIWKDRTDARWFYVEQAAASRLDKPYRQRVYRLTSARDSSFESAVFTLPEPLRFAGAWRQAAPLAALSPDSLTARDGCSVFLVCDGRHFVGGTRGEGCASDLRGAAYATSEVTLGQARLLSLDRGWDVEGKQVWGSTNGPYEFLRVKDR